jgi:hypothetical protein
VRAGSNLSNSRKKSSVIPTQYRRTIPNSKSVVTERDRIGVAHGPDDRRKLTDRFDKLRWQLVHRGTLSMRKRPTD